ncbi:MAG: S8 family serine peptidase [Candidatus Sigynarchaeota archaeon]
MVLANRKCKAIMLLACVLAMNSYITAYPAVQRDEATGHAPETLRIDPALLQSFQKGNPGDYLPVIITFNAHTYRGDSDAFLQAMAGSGFVLTHRFSIIPAISGRMRVRDLGIVESLSKTISFRVCENENLSIQISTHVPDSCANTNLAIEPCQVANWWHGMIGRNQSLVSSLNLSAIKVGVLDTGVGFVRSGAYAVHSDLAGSIAESVNFASGTDPADVYDWYGHGTHVAGIIAGSGAASGQVYAGIAHGVKIYNIKVLNASGSGLEEDIILGLEYAVNKSLDIVNLSLGGGNPDPLDPQSMAIKSATEQGVLVVIANGNDGPGYFTVTSPAAAVGAISVGAVNQDRKVTDFSSQGPSMGRIFKPDVVAPGEGIVSTLGSNSFIQKYYGYFELTRSGTTTTDNDYVALDGTSMATPMVVGAAAIILAKYRNYDLPPAVVATSLLESAGDLGYDTCTQGMGLINITGAIAFLESVKSQNNLTHLARIFPKSLPYAPYDIIDFPGQKSDVLVKILHHGTSDVHLDTTGIPAGVQLTVSPNTTTLNSSVGVTFLNVSISTSFDAMPGNYTMSLSLKNASEAILDNVTVKFTLHAPKLKVYLDSYHSLEDSFPRTFPMSRFAMDYYPYIKYLADQGIQVDTSMEYWTPGYNASKQKTPFVDSFLSKYDMVIIPPLKSDLFQAEFDALSRFHHAGGHLVLLGSRYQEFSIDGGNAVLKALGMKTRFVPTNHEYIRDNGWEHKTIDIILTAVNSSHVLGTNVTRLMWKAGCMLNNTDSRAQVVATSASGDDLIAFLPALGGNGSILVAGSESTLPASMTDASSAGNAKFFGNLFEHVMNMAGSVRIDVHMPTGIFYNETSLHMFFHVTNTTTGMHYVPANLTAASCKISNGSGVLLQVGLDDLASQWFGNSSVDITTLAFSPEPYQVMLNVTIGTQQFTRSFSFSKYNRSATVPRLSAIAFSGFRGSNLTLSFDATFQNETVMLSGNPGDNGSPESETIFSIKTIVSSIHDIVNSNTLTVPIGKTMPAGWYVLHFMHGTRTDVYPFETNQRTMIFVDNHNPDIDQQKTIFDGTSLDDVDLGNGRVRVLTARANQALQVVVAGTDNESSQGVLSAFAMFYPICIINDTAYLMPYGSQLIMRKLSYSAASSNFKGAITIPASVTFTIGSNQLTRQFTSWGSFAGAVILVLRDDDGAYDLAFIFINLTSGLTIDSWLILMLVLIAGGILGLVIAMIIMRRKRSREQMANPNMVSGVNNRLAVSSNLKLRFCPYCGAEIKVKTKYCLYCGEFINFT